MSNVSLFSYRDAPVRVVKTDGVHLFVIRDICNILGLSNPNRELSKYTENVPKYERIRTPGGLQVVRLVPRTDVEKLLCNVPGRRAGTLLQWLSREVYPALNGVPSDEASLPPWERGKKEKATDSPDGDPIRDMLLAHFALMQILMSVPVEQQPVLLLEFAGNKDGSKLKGSKKHGR